MEFIECFVRGGKDYTDLPDLHVCGGTPPVRGKNVIVIGGGNVAMDSARTALRSKADKVTIVYRRAMEQLPARVEEVHHAEQEGVIFQLLNNPVKFRLHFF